MKFKLSMSYFILMCIVSAIVPVPFLILGILMFFSEDISNWIGVFSIGFGIFVSFFVVAGTYQIIIIDDERITSKYYFGRKAFKEKI